MILIYLNIHFTWYEILLDNIFICARWLSQSIKHRFKWTMKIINLKKTLPGIEKIVVQNIH